MTIARQPSTSFCFLTEHQDAPKWYKYLAAEGRTAFDRRLVLFLVGNYIV